MLPHSVNIREAVGLAACWLISPTSTLVLQGTNRGAEVSLQSSAGETMQSSGHELPLAAFCSVCLCMLCSALLREPAGLPPIQRGRLVTKLLCHLR